MRTLPSLNFLTPTTPHKSCQSGKLENPNLGPCTPNILQHLCMPRLKGTTGSEDQLFHNSSNSPARRAPEQQLQHTAPRCPGHAAAQQPHRVAASHCIVCTCMCCFSTSRAAALSTPTPCKAAAQHHHCMHHTNMHVLLWYQPWGRISNSSAV